MHKKSLRIVEFVNEILDEESPMTLRQIYYQLVAAQVIPNNQNSYRSLSRLLVSARRSGLIAWDEMEDRLRKPRQVPMWDDVRQFLKCIAPAYKRDIWTTQPVYLEVSLEKDALSGLFGEICRKYRVTLNIGRGYDSWSSIKEMAARFGYVGPEKEQVILYFGDFDPSGENMPKSLRSRLSDGFGCEPNIVRCALTMDDVIEYNLPHELPKKGDPRTTKFIKEHGSVSVELDALKTSVLKQRLVDAIESRLDMDLFYRVMEEEDHDGERIQEFVETFA